MNTSKPEAFSGVPYLPVVSVQPGEYVIPKDRLLTVKDLQYIFSIGRNRAYELMNSKAFPTLKLGSRKYVSWNALQEWIDTYTGRQFLC